MIQFSSLSKKYKLQTLWLLKSFYILFYFDYPI